MKKILLSISIFLGITAPVFGAPILNYEVTKIPISDSLYDLGTSTKAWRELWVDTVCLTADSCQSAWPAGVGGSGFSTTSANYYNSQFRDWVINSFGALAPTTTRGIFVTASSTIQNLFAINGTTTNATSTTLVVSGSANIPKLSNLTSNGFVKTSGSDGTLSVDTNTYLTTGTAASTYIPYTGATTNIDFGVRTLTLGGQTNIANDTAIEFAGGGGGNASQVKTGSDGSWLWDTGNAENFRVDLGDTAGSNFFDFTNNSFSNSVIKFYSDGQVLITGSTTLQNFTGKNATTTSATTTNLAITGITGSTQCLQVDTNGRVTGSGSTCGTGSGSWATTSEQYFWSQFRDLSVQGNGYLAPTTTRGLLLTASSTIQNLDTINGTTTYSTSTVINTTHLKATASSTLSNTLINGTLRLLDDTQFLEGLRMVWYQDGFATEYASIGSDASDVVKLYASNPTNDATLNLASLTGEKIFTFPNKTGTFALTSDLWATTSQDYYNSQFRDWSVQGNGYLAPTTTRGVLLTSSSTIRLLDSLNSTSTNATSTNLYVSGTVRGAGLTDCDSDNQTLAWDATTGTFSCGDDDTGAGGGVATIKENNSDVTTSATAIDFASGFDVSGATGESEITLDLLEYNAAASTTLLSANQFWAGQTATTSINGAGTITIGGNIVFAGDTIDELVGAGLALSSNDLTVDNVTAAMLNAQDFGDFTCNGTTCSLDATYLTTVDISANTNLTAGDNLTLTDDDLDLDATLTNMTAATFSGLVTAGNFLATGSSTLQNFTGINATTTNATTTNQYVSGTFRGAGLTDCDADGQTLAWDATSGQFACGDDDSGGGGASFGQAWEIVASTYLAPTSSWPILVNNATSTITNLVTINSTSTNATTTNLNVTGQLDVDGLTSALTLTGAGGVFAEYTGTTCTNQFVRSLDAVGAATCATIGASDVSLANLSATDSTLTFSGTYNGSTARTIGLNLGQANTWTALQTFQSGFVSQASSTAISLQVVNGTTTNATSTNSYVSNKMGVATTTPWKTFSVTGEAAFDGGSAATSTVYINSTDTTKGGRIILKDVNGSTCTEITTLSGSISSKAVICP